MYIRSISVNKFRHIENLYLGPFHQKKTAEAIVLAGPNGGGKSTILELIGYALSNSYSLGWSLSRTFSDFSFEVEIGLSSQERELVISSIEKEIGLIETQIKELKAANRNEREIQSRETDRNNRMQYKDFFKTSSSYYRGYNLSTGEYQKKTAFYNQIHSYVTQELKNILKRSFGFFLRAERSYPNKSFERNRIFEYQSLLTQDRLWHIAFNTSDIQYADMFDFLVQQRYHYFRDLGTYQHSVDSKIPISKSKPTDPLIPYQNLLKELFPGYSFSEASEDVPSNLFIKLPTGQTIQFHDLSSGEKEVFFILSFFIRHNIRDSVIVIDEPELHLHPELARLLIRNMQKIRPGNQIWLATHNPEIIDETGRDSLWYVSRAEIGSKAVIKRGSEEDPLISDLRTLFGYSGFVGISRKLIFLEGTNTSADRKTFSRLFPKHSTKLKMIPASSCGTFDRINNAMISLLENNFGYVDFYVLRDRDYLTDAEIKKYINKGNGKLFVLNRHEIENYLLLPDAMSIVLKEVFDVNANSDEIESQLKSVCMQLSGEVTRDMIAYRINMIYRPQDFSVKGLLRDKPILLPSSNVDKSAITSLISTFQTTAIAINSNLSSITTNNCIEELIMECSEIVSSSLQNNDFLSLFPGKEILRKISHIYGLKNEVAFTNSLIRVISENVDLVDTELSEIIDTIAGIEPVLTSTPKECDQ